MRKTIILILLTVLTTNLFSQRLEEKPVSNLDDNTLFAVQDSGQLYNWRKISFEALQGEFNIFRTPYGNVAGVDSVAVLKGVTFYEDSVRIENTLNVGNTFTQNWGKKTNLEFPVGINSGNTQKSFIENGISFDLDGNNGVVLNGWVKPTPTENTSNMAITSHIAYTNETLNLDTVGKGIQNAAIQFNVIGDRWSDDGGSWLGNHRIKNHALFSFSQYGSGTQMTMFDDSVKVYQDFFVTSNNGKTKYFEVTKDNTKINNTLIGKKAVFSPDIAITNGGLTLDADRYYLGGTYRGNDRGSLSISPDANNGIGLNGWINPRPEKSGWNMSFTSHLNMTDDSANVVSNLVERAAMQFVVIGDRWDTLTGDWLGNSKVTNLPLFGFHSYTSGYQMGIWQDSVKVYRDFVVGNSSPNQTKYFEVTKDNTKINNALVVNNRLKLNETYTNDTIGFSFKHETANFYTFSSKPYGWKARALIIEDTINNPRFQLNNNYNSPKNHAWFAINSTIRKVLNKSISTDNFIYTEDLNTAKFLGQQGYRVLYDTTDINYQYVNRGDINTVYVYDSIGTNSILYTNTLNSGYTYEEANNEAFLKINKHHVVSDVPVEINNALVANNPSFYFDDDRYVNTYTTEFIPSLNYGKWHSTFPLNVLSITDTTANPTAFTAQNRNADKSISSGGWYRSDGTLISVKFKPISLEKDITDTVTNSLFLGQNGYRYINVNNVGADININYVFDSTGTSSMLFSNVLNADNDYQGAYNNSFLKINKHHVVSDVPFEVNNTLVANNGFKLSNLSYTPSSSTDLQAEAAIAEVGTKWLLNDSGTWYEVIKSSETQLVRRLYETW